MPVEFSDHRSYPQSVPVVVAGGGLCGLVAALSARDAGAQVVLLEREDHLGGSIQSGLGLIPAAATRFQKAAGINDTVSQFAADLQRKSRGTGDVRMTLAIAGAAGPALEWLADRHGLPWQLEQGLPPPGHAWQRLHGVPERSGVALVRRLEEAARRVGVQIITGSRVLDLHARPDGQVMGVMTLRRDGRREEIGCDALVLASGGFAANRSYRKQHLPPVADAFYAGHRGSYGDALHWGRLLGAGFRHIGSYFARAAFSVDYRQLLPRTLIDEGGLQINLRGERFGNEIDGEPDFAAQVMAQPEGLAWTIFDARIHGLAMGRGDYREVVASGAVRQGQTPAALAAQIGVSAQALGATLDLVRDYQSGRAVDPFGRAFVATEPLNGPFHAIRIVAALLHTQGGLAVDARGRVLREGGGALPNVFAGGHAACGVSGPHASGYLPGSGWLCALSLGRLAGLSAAHRAGRVETPPPAA